MDLLKRLAQVLATVSLFGLVGSSVADETENSESSPVEETEQEESETEEATEEEETSSADNHEESEELPPWTRSPVTTEIPVNANEYLPQDI